MFCPICNGECRGRECRFCIEYADTERKRNTNKTFERERYIYSCGISDFLGEFAEKAYPNSSVRPNSHIDTVYHEWEEAEDDD